MTDPEIRPLDTVLRELFEAERKRPDPPEAMKRRVYAAVLGASAATVGASAAASASRGLVARLSAHPLSWLVAATAVGTFAFVGARGLGDREARPTRAPSPESTPLVRPDPAVVPVQPRPSQEEPPEATPPEPVTGRAARAEDPKGLAPSLDVDGPVSATRRAARVVNPRGSAPYPGVDEPAPEEEVPAERPAPSTLAVERTMLERARRALAGGRPSEAIRVAAMHEGRYPTGQLSEERESLRIQALLALGERRRARARATEFRRRFPKSIFLPAIDAALGSP